MTNEHQKRWRVMGYVWLAAAVVSLALFLAGLLHPDKFETLITLAVTFLFGIPALYLAWLAVQHLFVKPGGAAQHPQLDVPTPNSSVLLPRPDDPFPASPHLFGREDDFKKLKEYLAYHKPPVIQLIGQSGVGKTALAAAVVRDLKLDYVRVELHNESADAVTNRLFEIFYEQPAPLKSHAELVALIVDAWQKRNCLLVIDNLHCLLNADSSPKDEAAMLLLQKLGEIDGQLLTLGWPGTESLGTGSERVVKWELEGIKEKPGVEKLRAEGVKGTPKRKTNSLEIVVGNLDGNPKMLELLAELIRKHGGQATLLDEYPSWVESSMAPLRVVWEAIGLELQELVAALCVFRRGRDAKRLARFLHPPVHGGGGRIQAQFESLISWGLARSIDGIHDYAPDHDLVRRMVREHFGEEKLLELHRRAANLWLEEGKDIGRARTPATLDEIQPMLEAGYHLAQSKSGDDVLHVLLSKRGDFTLDTLATMFGAWREQFEFWQTVAQYATDKRDRVNARLNVGIALQQRGDWDAALYEYTVCLETTEQLGDRIGMSKARHQIGNVYCLKGDLDKALVEYRASLEITEKLGDFAASAVTRHQIGNVYVLKGKWGAALEEYKISLKIKEHLGDRAGVASTTSQIGIVMDLQGIRDDALLFQKRSLQIRTELGDQKGMAVCHHAIGSIYLAKQNLEVAMAEYRISLKICEELDDQVGRAGSLAQIGRVFRSQKQFAEAFKYSLCGFRIFQQLGAKNELETSLDHLVALRRDWGAENFDRAWKEKTGEEVPEEIKKAMSEER